MKTLKTVFALLSLATAIVVLGGCNKGVGPPTPGTDQHGQKK